ncbi:MAG: efflux RND transporter permease subunit [Calditrichaeota bacterium]|nr:MAG: AcrB/AcrD/AcrF family protein [Calditrichota bacterium]MBL1205396.1 efflux RND transporter permease subunit [Calditrichota bacterium]NOG45225.1 efflux RND transporter permease subunit [Calditrichota bacterium]
MNISDFSVKNPVLINLLMVGIIIFGIITFLRMPTELNPEVSFNWVFVTVTYPGASPEECENFIVDPIEAEIQDIDNISEIQSNSGEGFGFIMVKFEDMSDSDFREHFTDLKAEVDKVDIPDDADDPIVDDFGSGDFMPVITINMSYEIPEDNAQLIADDLEKDLQDLPGVAKVQVSGLAKREIWIEVDPVKLNALNITFNEIVAALMARNINIPGGNISFGKTEYVIRSLGEYTSVAEIENSILRTSGNGDYIKISDVAKVQDRREEANILSRMNNAPSITFSMSKKSNANSIDVIDDIKDLVKKYEDKVPDGIEFSWSNDNSVYILRVINVLRNNAITGMVLIFLVLMVFLGKGNALLASLGIPISFFVAFILMDAFGYSLNGNTLFALVMVLGIIVDDAIIVVENCHRYRLLGYNSFESAVRGTSEVVTPILSSIGTNIAAFLPLILLPGIMGKFMRVIPVVFALALIASMFEAFLLLPSHYADWTTKSKTHKKGEKPFFKKLRIKYSHMLIRVLRRRYIVLVLLVLIFGGSFSIIGLVGVEMFGDEDFDQFRVLVRMPEGTSLQETDRVMKKFEDQANLLDKSNIQTMVSNIGLLQGQEEWVTRKSVAQLILELTPQEKRIADIDEILNDLREKTKNISGPISVVYEKVSGGPPVGKPISIKVQGKYLDDIKKASLALQDSIKKLTGAYGIADDFPPGKQEIRIKVNEEKAALFGFNTQYVSMIVRSAFDGVKAGEYRDGDDEIDMIVKYNSKHRSSVDDVLNLKVSNANGQTVALSDIVSFEIKPGPTQINRFDQKRTIMVTGEINENITTLDKINDKIVDLFPMLEQKFSGVTFSVGGQYEEFQNTFDNISSLFALSLVLVFLILGTQFNSYSQPLIIMTSVPFAIIGAMLGLLISGNPFSIAAMYGFVALAGIVINDAIVMIDFLNKRRNGKNTTVFQYWRSIINAGRLRLRPIILTSLTTISGLIPMAFGIGGKSNLWSPLANVILFGLLISTILTLFIIPSFIAILDDVKRSRKKARLVAFGKI